MLARAQKNTNAAALVKQLTASAKTKLDAVNAIRDFIAENIRVAGPSFTELPLSEFRMPTQRSVTVTAMPRTVQFYIMRC